MDKKDQLRQALKELKEEHKNSEIKLHALMKEAIPDYLEIQRVKKKKLDLKDQIKLLNNQLIPDIIA